MKGQNMAKYLTGRKLILATLVVFGLVACGDDDAGDTTTSETSTTSVDSQPGTTTPTTSVGGIDGTGKTFVMWTEAGSSDFQEAMKDTFLATFAEQTGYEVATDPFCCGLEKLRTQVDSGDVQWNVLQFASQGEFEQAKEEGLLEPLDTSVVPVDLLEDGTYDEYGYDALRNAFVLGYLPETYPDEATAPDSFDDLFRPEDFPGKRCLFQYPQYAGTLEGALMADGVAPADVYPLDVERALARLSSMKDDIVWYESGSEAAQLLLNGSCDMAAILNGVAQGASNRGDDITIAWDNSVIVPVRVAIPKGTPDLAAAQLFLGNMLSDTEDQVAFYRHVAYTFPLKDSPLPEDVAKWTPEGENDDNTITEDWSYYRENIEAITDRFNNWLVTGE